MNYTRGDHNIITGHPRAELYAEFLSQLADYEVPHAPASPMKKFVRERRQKKEMIERNIKSIKEFTTRFRQGGSLAHNRNNSVSSPFAFKDTPFIYEAMTPAAALAHGYTQKKQ